MTSSALGDVQAVVTYVYLSVHSAYDTFLWEKKKHPININRRHLGSQAT